MKVLLINGSPHKNGCTATALEIIAEELKRQNVDSEILWVSNNPVRGCVGCWSCRRGSRRCVFKEDVVNEWLNKMEEADGLVLGSPVHFAGASGVFTTLMDRFFMAGQEVVAYKPGAVICSARRAGTTATFDQMMKYLTMNNMITVPSPYWNMVHGNKPEEVLQDKEGIYIMKSVASGLVWLMEMISYSKEYGKERPIAIEKATTNFIR